MVEVPELETKSEAIFPRVEIFALGKVEVPAEVIVIFPADWISPAEMVRPAAELRPPDVLILIPPSKVEVPAAEFEITPLKVESPSTARAAPGESVAIPTFPFTPET